MDKNEKFGSMADKNPRKALYYVLWVVIGVLGSFAGLQYRANVSLRADCEKREDRIRSEAKKEEKEKNAQIVALLKDALEQEKSARKRENEISKEQILKLYNMFEGLQNKTHATDKNYEGLENKVDKASTQIKQIEKIIPR